jgi:hypothetical protein
MLPVSAKVVPLQQCAYVGPIKMALLVSCLGLAAAPGCGDETVPGYEVDCEDDGIGWLPDIAGIVEPPPAEFGVECASGWGHGVETRAASEVVELPNSVWSMTPHPQGGLLLYANLGWPLDDLDPVWSQQLGVDVATRSLAWLDDQAKELRWLRDDLDYAEPFVVSTEAGTELWVWGYGAGTYLSRIEPSTGELLERVEWPDGAPRTVAAAWPEDGGMWYATLEGTDEDVAHHELRRMSSFAELGPVVRTFEALRVSSGEGPSSFFLMSLHPTPGGGLLGNSVTGEGRRLESVAEDGNLRWVLEQGHVSCVVDEHGGFLLGNVSDGGEPDDRQYGLTLQRRKLDDASVLWTRVHHRYEFAGEPDNHWLWDTGYTYTARAEGGYLVAGGHAYPASGCYEQPIIWAIDINGEVEWAHRVEACGTFYIPSDRVEGRALVLGHSYVDGVYNYANIKAQWLQYFDL